MNPEPLALDKLTNHFVIPDFLVSLQFSPFRLHFFSWILGIICIKYISLSPLYLISNLIFCNNSFYLYTSNNVFASVSKGLFSFSILPCLSIPLLIHFSLIPVIISCIHEFRGLPFLLLLLLLLPGGHLSKIIRGSLSSFIPCTWSCQYNCFCLV